MYCSPKDLSKPTKDRPTEILVSCSEQWAGVSSLGPGPFHVIFRIIVVIILMQGCPTKVPRP